MPDVAFDARNAYRTVYASVAIIAPHYTVDKPFHAVSCDVTECFSSDYYCVSHALWFRWYLNEIRDKMKTKLIVLNSSNYLLTAPTQGRFQ